jgi:predicted permease
MLSGLRRLCLRLVHALRPERAERDLAREVASHLALLEDELVRRGMTREQAYTEARKQLGGAESAKQLHRDNRSFRWLDELLIDVRQAWRTVIRNKRSTVASILILTTVGAVNALVFGLADAVLLRPLPYRDADRVFIVMMMNEATGQRFTRVGNDVLQALARPDFGLSGAGILGDGPRITVNGPEGPTGIVTASATPNYFEVLGIRPAVGRAFADADTRVGRHVALLSHEAWQTHFGRDPDVVGASVALGNTTLDVVGVLPPGAFLPTFWGDAPAVVVAAPYPRAEDEKAGAFYPVVRLGDGTTVEQAQAALTAVAGASQTGTSATSIPVLDSMRSVLFPAGRTIMSWLVACTLALVVLAGVNLAALFLVRGLGRARDTGVKLALGASRTRIIRPVFLEVTGICAVGGLVAVAIARQVFEPLLEYVPQIVYRNAPVGVDLRVGLITMAGVTLATCASTFLATWFSSRRDADALIRSAGGGRSSSTTWRRGRTLVTTQIALTVVLVFGAAITVRAFVTLLNAPLGFDPANVMTAGMVMPRTGTIDYEHVLRSIGARPGVESVGGAARMPFDGSGHDDGVALPDGRRLGVTHILPDYFETIRRPLIRGRHVTWNDYRDDPGAVVVSESAARMLSANGDALGASFANRFGRTLHAVGIVADATYDVGGEPQASVYGFAGAPDALRRMNVVVRTTHRSDVLLQDLRMSMQDHFPTARIRLGWWHDSIANVTGFRNPRFQTMVLTSLSGVALVLTMVGIVGVMGSLVASRTKELAVRAAIGATPGSLVRLVVRQGLVPVAAGVVAGLVATRWASRFAEAQLFAVDTTGVVGATLAATVVPARRAGRVDPVSALKSE